MNGLFAVPESPTLWHPPHREGRTGVMELPLQEEEEPIVSAMDAHFGTADNVTVTLLMGPRGQGKTLCLAGMQDVMIRRYERAGYPGRVFSNFKTWFIRHAPDGRPIDYYSPYMLEDVSEFPAWFRRGYMTVDEIQSMASSRRAMSKGNVFVSSFLTQIRHRDIETLFTTQYPQVLDYQLLIQVNYFVRIRCIARYRDGFPALLQLYIFDYWGQDTGKDWRKRWPPAMEDVDDIRLLTVPHSLRGAWNTHQIIASSYWGAEVRNRVNLEEANGEEDWMKAMNQAMDTATGVISDNPMARFEFSLPRGIDFAIGKKVVEEANRASRGKLTDAGAVADWLDNTGRYDITDHMGPSGHRILRARRLEESLP